MELALWLSAFGLAVTVIGMFAALMRTIGRIELKLQLVWEWYLSAHQPEVRIAGRRSYDPPALAHDDGAEARPAPDD